MIAMVTPEGTDLTPAGGAGGGGGAMDNGQWTMDNVRMDNVRMDNVRI
ncbi:MAG: hypothetical protein FWF88_03185 [Peptococcaceae bacterium]|nr:hypothetical protein [Peptococcaceae bacterium]